MSHMVSENGVEMVLGQSNSTIQSSHDDLWTNTVLWAILLNFQHKLQKAQLVRPLPTAKLMYLPRIQSQRETMWVQSKVPEPCLCSWEAENKIASILIHWVNFFKLLVEIG